MSENFFIEPWQIEESSDTLTLREEAVVPDFVLGGGVALGLSLIVAALDVWLWRRGTIDGGLAAWLGFASALLAAKGIEQLFQGWRVTSRGPRCLTFRRDDFTVELKGFRGATNGRVERIVISVKTWLHEPVAASGSQPQKEYKVLLFVDGQRLELGIFGAEAAASRLAESIANCVGIRASRISEDN